MQAASSSQSKRVVLVTGANGGTGRRVVRDLLREGGYVVRAMTRTRERLEEAMGRVGVNLEEEEKQGRVEVVVSDLYNVRDEMFEDLVAVVSCTGVNVGPRDDPDRSKYFQGIKFYEPEVLDDSAQNVEYVGVRRLMDGVKKWWGGFRTGGVDVLKFDDEEEVRRVWGALDDVVMGGVSSSYAKASGDGELLFGGEVRTENSGGFCSVRSVNFERPLDLSGFEGLRLKVRGDGKRFKLIVRCENRWDGVAQCFSFVTKKEGWTIVEAPFDEFRGVFRAKTVEGEKLDAGKIFAFQLMLSKFEYDGDLNPEFAAGKFELRVASIEAYKAGEEVMVPRVVFMGSAGVTRVLRLEEFDVEKQPPAVRMNDMLGRILEWKLAGEDVVRRSGVPYTIVRPCALTEKEAVGIEKLKFEQGDRMTGQVPREDVAKLLVEALKKKDLVDKTVEVGCVGEGGKVEGRAEERMRMLKVDAEETERGYASFPYVPAEEAVKS